MGKLLLKLLESKLIVDSSEEITQSEKLQRYITFKLATAAEIYRNITFYLNVHSDWRSRIYTHSFFLSYQGGDLSSAINSIFRRRIFNRKGFNVYLNSPNQQLSEGG